MVTDRPAVVPKLTHAPQVAPVHCDEPGEVPLACQVPWPVKGRSKTATKCTVYVVGVVQKSPLVTEPSSSSAPTTCTDEVLTNDWLPLTLKRRLPSPPAGKVNRPIPVRVVAASCTSVAGEPTWTW